MIISHKNKFILLRVPKTGSTSLEASVRFCGAVDPSDICSQTEDANLSVQNIPQTYKMECQRHTKLTSIAHQKVKMGAELSTQESALLAYPHKWMFFFEHNTLDDLFNIGYYKKLNLITEEQTREYNTYGFFRDPFERYLSSFIFYQVWSGAKTRNTKPITIEEFHKFTEKTLHKNNNILFRPQVHYFYFKGEQIVKPLLFDNWAEEASRMIKEIGFHPLKVYPRFKEAGQAKNRFPNGNPKVKDWITPYGNIVDNITEHFEEDIEFYKKIKN